MAPSSLIQYYGVSSPTETPWNNFTNELYDGDEPLLTIRGEGLTTDLLSQIPISQTINGNEMSVGSWTWNEEYSQFELPTSYRVSTDDVYRCVIDGHEVANITVN